MALAAFPVAPGAAFDDAALAALDRDLAGDLVTPGHPGYAAARRVWNGMVDRYPAAIAYCTGVVDVVAGIAFAREHGLPLAVRGGGHSVGGASVCVGGLVLDLSPMKGVQVDPARRVARAEAGLLLGELDRATQEYGLAVPAGQVSHTGIAGLTLGGGTGWLMRTHGLTVDNVLAVEFVTADGEFLRASETEHPELFWALRGGGGNFGVVTAFEYRLHPVGPLLLAGVILYPMEQAHEVLRFSRDFIATAPDEVNLVNVFLTVPPAPTFPAHLHGQQVLAVGVNYAGAIEDGERVLAPLRAFGAPAADMVGPMPYVALQSMIDAAAPHGLHYWEKAGVLRTIDDAAIATLIEEAKKATSPMSQAIVAWFGGAASRVPGDATAFAHRDVPAMFWIVATFPGGDPAPHAAWARDFAAALKPFGGDGVYVNTLGSEGSSRVREAYPAATYDRLVAAKNRYDPTNLFRLNQNIAPTVGR